MRAGAGICKQHLDITSAHVVAVGFVGGANIAGNPAHHVQQITFIKRGRCKPCGIVNLQADFGEISSWTGGGACEDHIFHTAAAHRSGPVFSHDPT